jgi:methylenetetrahydrofolate reductase (NADPH)
VNNDFHQPRTIFEVLGGLTVPNLDKVPQLEESQPHTNGTVPVLAAVEA